MFFVLYQIAYIISRNFHCDAIIPVKLFWCVALEPMAGSKCKPGQGQWALKLESCCDVIKTLFSTAMAAQDNVSALKALLEENGCNTGRYSACDVMILSQTGQLAQWFSTWGSSGIFLGVARAFVRNPFVADLDVVNVFNRCLFIALHLILGGNLYLR